MAAIKKTGTKTREVGLLVDYTYSVAGYMNKFLLLITKE